MDGKATKKENHVTSTCLLPISFQAFTLILTALSVNIVSALPFLLPESVMEMFW